MKSTILIFAAMLLSGMIETTSAQTITAPEVTAVMDVTPPQAILSPTSPMKTKLTQEELKKFLELATYAEVSNYGHLYEPRNCTVSTKFSVYGDRQDGYLVEISHLEIKYEDYYLGIYPNGVLGGLADVSTGEAVYPDQSTPQSQEIIKRMLKFWMDYNIPNK